MLSEPASLEKLVSEEGLVSPRTLPQLHESVKYGCGICCSVIRQNATSGEESPTSASSIALIDYLDKVTEDVSLHFGASLYKGGQAFDIDEIRMYLSWMTSDGAERSGHCDFVVTATADKYVSSKSL